MPWSESDVPPLNGKVALVTGANSGLGLENTRALTARGATVIMAARNTEKAELACDQVLARYQAAQLEVRQLDLASLDSIDRFAVSVLDDYDRLDIMINNAGVMALPQRRTTDGFEMQLGTNHLGHYVLTARLLPLLVDSDGSRVVAVTSTARHFGRPIDPSNPHLEGTYDKWRAYGQSKLANVHFALGLEQRLRAAGAPTISLVAHPGLARTELQVNTAREGGGESSERMARRYGMSPADGALPQLRAATDPEASGGELYAPRWVNWGPPVRRPLMGRSRDVRSIATLIRVSEDLTGVPLEVPGTKHT